MHSETTSLYLHDFSCMKIYFTTAEAHARKLKCAYFCPFSVYKGKILEPTQISPSADPATFPLVESMLENMYATPNLAWSKVKNNRRIDPFFFFQLFYPW